MVEKVKLAPILLQRLEQGGTTQIFDLSFPVLRRHDRPATKFSDLAKMRFSIQPSPAGGVSACLPYLLFLTCTSVLALDSIRFDSRFE